jgi:ketosteroid isomerase-like protein
MATPNQTLIDLENRFWQSIVDEDTDTALDLLTEPALLVNAHGTMKFSHADYRKMADQGPMVVTSFELSNMQVVFPNDSTAVLSYHVREEVAQRGEDKRNVQEMNDTSTWVKTNGGWRCAMHTETPASGEGKTQ